MPDKALSQFLKELRQTHDFTRSYVASQLNITRQTYSHYETDRITPPLESLFHLAQLYEISLDDFLDLTITDFNQHANASKNLQNESTRLSSDFWEYINRPENLKKYYTLGMNEKELLYYYHSLDTRDQTDIMDILRVKYKRKNQKN